MSDNDFWTKFFEENTYEIGELEKASKTGVYDLTKFWGFIKSNKKNRVWWNSPIGYDGMQYFSFDKKKLYNLFQDFPRKLTKEEIKIFVEEEPYWANFFRKRLEEISYNLPSKIIYNGQELSWEEYIEVKGEECEDDEEEDEQEDEENP